LREAIYKNGAAVEVDAGALSTFVACLDFVTVYGLQFEEVPQNARSDVAILNVTGWCEFSDSIPTGLCVMVVGRDLAGEILWACCLMAQSCGDGPQHLLESLLVTPAVLGQTARVSIRVYGGYLSN
jgi:hypothetical protein